MEKNLFTTSRISIVSGSCGALLCCCSFAICGPVELSPARVSDRDFVVAGIHEGFGLDEVQKILGPFSGTITDICPGPPSTVGWSFVDLEVHTSGTHSVTGFVLTGPSHATSRGLRVGDGIDKVKKLYGKPDKIYYGTWYYDGPNGDRHHLVKVYIEAKKVTRISIGWDII
jgi:hypothetical protein